MKFSRQRQLIFQTVMENPIHPSADVVYDIVRKQLPSISLGTVYRNLNLLSQLGELQKISMPNASDHFDGRTEEHCHGLCNQCGNVFDVEAPNLSLMMAEPPSGTDFCVTDCYMHFSGICHKCATKGKLDD